MSGGVHHVRSAANSEEQRPAAKVQVFAKDVFWESFLFGKALCTAGMPELHACHTVTVECTPDITASCTEHAMPSDHGTSSERQAMASRRHFPPMQGCADQLFMVTLCRWWSVQMVIGGISVQGSHPRHGGQLHRTRTSARCQLHELGGHLRPGSC